MHYTPFLAALEVGFGLAMLIGGALLRAARTRIRSLNGLAVGLGMVIVTLAGGAALGLGIVVLIDAWPTQLHHWFNPDHRDGVLYFIAGAVAIGAAITSPVVLAPAVSPTPQQPELASPPEPASASGPSPVRRSPLRTRSRRPAAVPPRDGLDRLRH